MGKALRNRASTSNFLLPLTTCPDDIKQLNVSVWEFYKPPLDGDGVPKMEILFFHGAQLSIDTGAFWKTWLSRDETVVWPTAWLAQKFPEARMLFISYDSSIRKSSGSSGFSGQKDTYQTIENLMHDIIWSSTCKAGQKCPESHACKKSQCFCNTAKPSSTPNAGSRMVDGLAYIEKLFCNFNPSVVDFLKTLSPQMARINDDFSKLRHDRKWKSVGIGETLQTISRDFRKTMVVPQASARQDVDQIYWAQDADHFDVTRAKNNFSCNIFTMLCDLLRSSTDEHESIGQSNLVEVKKRLTNPLPFGQDSKYVPIVYSVDKVRKALESEHGCHVVTVCGEPGLGKTSLVKYVALQYQPHHTPQVLEKASSFAMFPDGVVLLRCGQGAEHKIRELQHNLLQSLGCEAEAVPLDIPEERDGDYVTIPTLRRRLQFKLKDVRALIILDDVWKSSILEELILSPDEAGSVKYLLTSQFRDIWPDAVNVEMGRPTLEEARQILLKYTKGLSTIEGFPRNIMDTADSIIAQLHFHPLTLAKVGLGFRQGEGQELEAWRAMEDAWEHEPPIKESYRPLIYGRGYPFALDMTMTRVMRSLEGPTRDLLLLMCALNQSNALDSRPVPEPVVKYLYKCAQIGSKGEYRFAINHLQNSSLVDVFPYGSGRTEVIIHKLRALSILSQFPDEVRVVTRRALEPVRMMYDHLGAQSTVIGGLIRRVLRPVRELYNRHGAETTLIPVKYYDSTDVHDGLLNASMVGMYIDRVFKDHARVVIPRGVDFDVNGLLETAGGKERHLRELVRLLHPNPTADEWEREAASCAEKVIVRFACRHELDDKSVARLIQLRIPVTRVEVLRSVNDIIGRGYWCTSFFEQNKSFSSAHSEIVRTLCALKHDNTTSKVTLQRLVELLFGGDYPDGIMDYETDETIVSLGEWLIKLALGKNTNMNFNFQCVLVHKFPSSYSRAFRVIEKKIPPLWNAMLTVLVQRSLCGCEWFSSLHGESNGAHDVRDDTGLLEMLCDRIDPQFEGSDALEILAWLSTRVENRVHISANHQIMSGVMAMLIHASQQKGQIAFSIENAALLLRNLAVSQEIRQKILSTYPSLVETLERLEQCEWHPRQNYISQAIGILHSDALYLKFSDYNPTTLKTRFEWIIKGRIQGYFQRKMYEEFLAFMEGNPFPRNVKQQFTTEIIVAEMMLKRYESALAHAHAKVLEEEGLCKEYPQGSQFRRTAWAVGLEGTAKLLSGKNLLSEVLADFEKAVGLLLTSNRWSIWSSSIWDSISDNNGYHVLMYEMLKQRGFTKYLMGDDEAGAREDARAAQQLHHRNLVWDGYYNRFSYPSPESLLFSRPLAYLGFNFTF